MGPSQPYISPPDFCLWEFLRDNIYTHNCRTIGALEMEVTQKIRVITEEEWNHIIDHSPQVQVANREASDILSV